MMIQIRPIIESDLTKLLWNKEQEKWKELDEQHFEQIQSGKLLWYVALKDGQLIGRIKVMLVGHTGKPMIFALRVRDDMQQQGIGTMLIKKAEDALREKGANIVSISVEKTDEKVLHMYKKLHYKPIGERIDHWSYFENGKEITYDLDVYDLEKNL